MLSARLFRTSHLLLGTAFLTVTLGDVAAQGTLPSDVRSRLAALLPDSGQSAQVMSLVRDSNWLALQRKLQQAIAQDTRWFDEYRRVNATATDLPWNAKFGLSRDEWEAFNKDSGWRFIRTVPAQTVRVAFQRVGNRVTFLGTSGAEGLDGLSLDLSSGEMRLPEGYTTKPYSVDITVRNGRDTKSGYVDPFGQSRRGLAWKFVVMNSTTQVSAYVHLLQLENGSVVLSYDRSVGVRNQKLLPKVEIRLQFDKRAGASTTKRTN
ncbi:hypothetical protein [Deinococcus yavapaiensis]|uniref:Uncharacterized protein n=1 Tax=Deinococcus yavapaiensis KR-236 TaxID=694435 RepID=A0A318S4L6_9DEIO|nr:hypothetical protein [Deinococcus yavapaiensis]PYE53533.1 hypothetical protein DES52_10862 [Deinococcus yavapaiensis KR-236]